MSDDMGVAPARTPRPPGTADDVRAAANIQVTIANLVMTAGLAIIAAEAGITTFYLEHRNLQMWAEVLLIIAAILVIAGFILGGKALNNLSVKGYYGDWSIFRVADLFNAQAVVNLIAALLVVFAVSLGSSPIIDTKEEARLRVMEQAISHADGQIQLLKRELNALRAHQTGACPQPRQPQHTRRVDGTSGVERVPSSDGCV